MNPRRSIRPLRTMLASGLTLEQSLSQLRGSGASIIECIVAVKEVRGCELSEAKQRVYESSAWRDVAEATDKMWRELSADLDKDRNA